MIQGAMTAERVKSHDEGASGFYSFHFTNSLDSLNDRSEVQVIGMTAQLRLS